VDHCSLRGINVAPRIHHAYPATRTTFEKNVDHCTRQFLQRMLWYSLRQSPIEARHRIKYAPKAVENSLQPEGQNEYLLWPATNPGAIKIITG
jgi:hypothetical protein